MQQERFGALGWTLTILGMGFIIAVLVLTASGTPEAMSLLIASWSISLGILVAGAIRARASEKTIHPELFLGIVTLCVAAAILLGDGSWMVYHLLRTTFVAFSLTALILFLAYTVGRRNKSRQN